MKTLCNLIKKLKHSKNHRTVLVERNQSKRYILFYKDKVNDTDDFELYYHWYPELVVIDTKENIFTIDGKTWNKVISLYSMKEL